MKLVALIVPILAAALAFASRGDAELLRYWGTPPEGAIGWIELGHGQYYEIGTGTDIPGWGRVKRVGVDHLVVEQVRTEVEKRRLHERGALVTDVLEIHVLREDLRHPRWEIPPGPRR
jgi:hypothetical protein